MRAGSMAIALILGGLAGCYSAEFNPELDGVYRCLGDDECGENFACINWVCMDERGPSVEILTPESKTTRFMMDEVGDGMSIVMTGSGLTLTEPGGANADGMGYLSVTLDGEPVAMLTSGSLSASPSTEAASVPSQPGLHRIEVVAMRNDQTPYPNPGARAISVFWLDDGLEHVGIVQPAPGSQWAPHPETGNAEISMEFVSLNFDILNPNDAGDPMAMGQGHVHVLFDPEAPVPECIETTNCNDVYVAAVFPLESGAVTNISPSPNPQPVSLTGPGIKQLAIVAQYSSHDPYPEANADTVVHDAIDIEILP